MRQKPTLTLTKTLKCGINSLWLYTQDPNLHIQWDLRFPNLRLQPKQTEETGQKFTFKFNQIPLHGSIIRTVNKDKTRSSLSINIKFKRWTLAKGTEEWYYRETKSDCSLEVDTFYHPKMALLNPILSLLWKQKTRMSFNALGHWIDFKTHPRETFSKYALLQWVNIGLAFAWIYMGLFPKILFPETGELELVKSISLFSDWGKEALLFIGLGEIIFGLCFLIVPPNKKLYQTQVAALVILTVFGLLASPMIAFEPFNPVVLTVVLSIFSLLGTRLDTQLDKRTI